MSNMHNLQSRSKLLGPFPFFPIPPLQCWFFTVSEIKIRSSITHMFQHCLGGRGRAKGSKRRTRIAQITIEACTVNFLLFAQNLTSVPKSFDPDCRSSRLFLLTKSEQTEVQFSYRMTGCLRVATKIMTDRSDAGNLLVTTLQSINIRLY